MTPGLRRSLWGTLVLAVVALFAVVPSWFWTRSPGDGTSDSRPAADSGGTTDADLEPSGPDDPMRDPERGARPLTPAPLEVRDPLDPAVEVPDLEALHEDLRGTRGVRLAYEAAVALGRAKDPTSEPFLIDCALGRGDSDVRAAAVRALGFLGSPPARRSLVQIAGYRDEELGIRLAAVGALGEARGRTARDALLDLILALDSPVLLRRRAVVTIGRFLPDEGILDALERAGLERDAGTRADVLAVLDRFGSERAKAIAARLLASPPATD